MRTWRSAALPLTVAAAVCVFELVLFSLLSLGQDAASRCAMSLPVSDPLANAVLLGDHWLCLHPLLQQIALLALIIALVFTIHAAARSVTNDARESRLGTILAIGGIGLGWLAPVVFPLIDFWNFNPVASPDLATSFSVLPAITQGTLATLSLVLVVYVMYAVWKTIDDESRNVWFVLPAIAALTLLRPAFIPLIAATVFIAWAKQVRDAHRHRPLLHPVLLLASLLPSIAYNLWIIADPANRASYTDAYTLPLASFHQWMFILAPAIIAMLWISKHHDRKRIFFRNSRWCLSWLLTAGVMAILLPVSWAPQLIEGLMIPLVLFTLPAWFELFDALPRPARVILLTGIVGATPLFLIVEQITRLRQLL